VGLNWDGARFVATTERASLEDRPWSPAPKRPRAERIVRPGRTASQGADPADPAEEPADAPPSQQ
jgi:hypothetical protein